MYDKELMDVLDISIDSVGCGQVLSITPREIIVLDSRRIILKYFILRYDSSNQGTCYDLRPLVRPDEKVWLGQCLAIGPTADWLRGAPSGISRTPVSELRTLALGRNVTLAYSTWDGYNFEDGILISEEFVHSGVYNSVLIRTLSIAITKTDVLDKSYLELPASVIDHLDKYAIVKLGTLTVKGLILVGRMTLRKYRAKGLAARQKEASDGAERLIRTLLGQDAVPNYTLNPLRAKSKEAGRVVKKNILTTANNSASGTRIEIQIGFIRTLQLGDKFCGRYGNKGVIASVATFEEMAHYRNGIPLDMLLNPLGVPSRLNMSQVYESALGFEFCRKSVFNRDADEYRPEGFIVPAFDEEIANYESSQESRGSVLISTYRLSVQQKIDNKFDNRPLTGVTEFLLNEPYVSCGYPGSPFLTGDQYRVRLHDAGTPTSGDCALGTGYMLKLIHLADDKFHVRDNGPYSSLTQQPTQGKSSDGGQRLGEMEVWAFEAWGAYYNLWELFTIKSDEIQGRRHIPTALLEGFGTTEYLFGDAPLAGDFIINPESVLPGTPGVPETFRLFVRELQSLCLDLSAFRSPTANNKNQEQINLFDFPLSTTDPFRPPEPKW
jgi:DNA-directed RNA polymerase subunit beta